MTNSRETETMLRIPLRIDDQEINVEEPWNDDKLNRQKCADALTNLISNQPGPLVISLNGAWGTGKTFFLKRWKADLEKKGYMSIYFNAWEDDFIGNPLVSIIGQIWEALKIGKFSEIEKSFKDNLTPALAKILLNTLKISILI